MADPDFFEKIDFHIRISGDAERLEICPVIDADIPCSRTLIASFAVDGLEMIESARIALNAGITHTAFQQPVEIIRPMLWQPRSMGKPYLYKFTVTFYRCGEICHTIEKMFSLRLVERDAHTKGIRLNGQELSEIALQDTILLTDSDTGLEERLCDSAERGLMVILKLTGQKDPASVGHSPGVCIFSAEPDSPGALLYHAAKDLFLPPLFSAAELKNFLRNI